MKSLAILEAIVAVYDDWGIGDGATQPKGGTTLW